MVDLEPYTGTATERRRLRGDIRNSLGVSSQPAPDFKRLMYVVKMLDRMLSVGWGWRLRLVRPDNSTLDGSHAVQWLREAGA